MTTTSNQIFEKLTKLIPGGVNSPARAFGLVDVKPIVAASAKGDLLIDADDKTFIDFVCGWGALILGHNHPAVVSALEKQLEKGICFVNSHELELELAETIQSLMPHMEKMRFVSSGTEATMSAIRLARAYSEKNLLVKFDGNYHGHSDPLLVKAGSAVATINSSSSSKGVPDQNTVSLPFNDIDALQNLFDQRGGEIGAVIVEPVVGNMGVVPALQSFLQKLRDLTEKYSAILIFDEVMCGFRIGLHGAQKLYGITPDLTCLGKIIGGGLPAAAFGGKREIMDQLAPLGEVYQAGTLSGSPMAMAAGLATLREISKPGVFEELIRKKQILIKDLPACVQHVGAMFTIFWGAEKVQNFEDSKKLDHTLFRKFFSFAYDRGIYFPQSPYEAGFISLAHTDEHLRYVRSVLDDFSSSGHS